MPVESAEAEVKEAEGKSQKNINKFKKRHI